MLKNIHDPNFRALILISFSINIHHRFTNSLMIDRFTSGMISWGSVQNHPRLELAVGNRVKRSSIVIIRIIQHVIRLRKVQMHDLSSSSDLRLCDRK